MVLHFIKMVLILFLISCGKNKDNTEGPYFICVPFNSGDCQEVEKEIFLNYEEQYQICVIEQNEFECLNIYDFES